MEGSRNLGGWLPEAASHDFKLKRPLGDQLWDEVGNRYNQTSGLESLV